MLVWPGLYPCQAMLPELLVYATKGDNNDNINPQLR